MKKTSMKFSDQIFDINRYSKVRKNIIGTKIFNATVEK